MYMTYELPDREVASPAKRFPVVTALIALAFLAGCQALAPHPTLPMDTAANQLEVRPGVYLAGEINSARIDDLVASGAMVIDLRTQVEGTAEEAAALIAAGVGYVNLPVAGASVDPATVASVTSLLEARAGRPVVLHCRSGNRAGMLYAAHLIDRGVNAGDALREVDAVVTVEAVRDAISDYAAPK